MPLVRLGRYFGEEDSVPLDVEQLEFTGMGDGLLPYDQGLCTELACLLAELGLRLLIHRLPAHSDLVPADVDLDGPNDLVRPLGILVEELHFAVLGPWRLWGAFRSTVLRTPEKRPWAHLRPPITATFSSSAPFT